MVKMDLLWKNEFTQDLFVDIFENLPIDEFLNLFQKFGRLFHKNEKDNNFSTVYRNEKNVKFSAIANNGSRQ